MGIAVLFQNPAQTQPCTIDSFAVVGVALLSFVAFAGCFGTEWWAFFQNIPQRLHRLKDGAALLWVQANLGNPSHEFFIRYMEPDKIMQFVAYPIDLKSRG